MRLVKYDVELTNGEIITMTSFTKAKKCGKILRTYLVPVDEDYFMTDKEKEEKVKRDSDFRKKVTFRRFKQA